MKKSKKSSAPSQTLLFGDDAPFDIREAYIALRSNIMFTLPGERCKKLMITSSSRGEGKSTTAINLALSIAQNGSRVLLIDADLRLPTVAKKLDLPQKPGLTNLLYGISDAARVVHHLPSGLDVIPSGNIPPNPSETLGSLQMKKMIDVLSDLYDYILIDTPPVGTVTDAAVVSQMMSGVLMVVREGMADQEILKESMTALQNAEAKVLGFVMTGTKVSSKKYGKRYGKKYGKSYEYRYGYGKKDS